MKAGRIAAFFVLTILACLARADLTGDNLLLIVNRNQPAGAELASYYARVRGVPEGQIIALDLPTADDIPRRDYEQKVVAELQQWFKDSPAKDKIRCLVTFYGVPLRVGPEAPRPGDGAELKQLNKLLELMEARAGDVAAMADQLGKDCGVNLPRGEAKGIAQAMNRALRVEKAIQDRLRRGGDAASQQRVLSAGAEFRKKLATIAWECLEQSAAQVGAQTTTDKSAPATAPLPKNGADANPTTHNVVGKLSDEEQLRIVNSPRDADARDKLRRIMCEEGGFFRLALVVKDQVEWINTDQTNAAVDSELATVLWKDFPRHRWQTNPLAPYNGTAPPFMTRTLMVCRIDGPDARIARRIIDDAIAIEPTGLSGTAAFDARGLDPKKPGPDPNYAIYDELMRGTMAFFQTHSTLKIVFDDRPGTMPPGTASDVAIYTGWYSLRTYIPSCKFTRGAVAAHVASHEMISLHNPKEKGWCANLLKDGVAATFGAVDEPYLGSFPRVDEFWPLLASGKFCLAETYWKTCPMVSWQQTLVGDPLYNPFKNKPAVKMEDLAQGLQELIKGDSTAGNRPDGR